MSEAAAQKPAPPPQTPFNFRLAMGLLGVLLAAMVAGLNEKVAGLTLPDISGALGFSHDGASWLDSFYAAGEMAAMPFSTWFAITFSLRRFHLLLQAVVLLIALILPGIHNLYLLCALRLLQGFFAGALIPLLMMAALRFLPAPIRLHGLALYAMTATLAPNIGIWLAAVCVDYFNDWRLVYWHIIPLGLIAMGLVGWGIPKLPLALPRIKQGNWLGMAIGIPGLMLLAIAFSQGVRLDWFNSPIVCAAMFSGGLLTALFLYGEWCHPTPFIKLQMVVERRNLWLGFTVFFLMLMGMSSAVVIPVQVLESLHDFRMPQLATLGLIVGLPQLVLGSVVAILLYQRWVDARKLFALGLALMALACWLNTSITSQWMVAQFFWAQVLQALGQPMAVVSLLFLATSMVQPMEGPYVSGIVNVLRAMGTTFAGGIIGQILKDRSDFHRHTLAGELGHWQSTPVGHDAGQYSGLIGQQSAVMASADLYWLFTGLFVVLIPVVLCLKYIPAPVVNTTKSANS
ncbi:MFS transporter [Gallaecimonas mangrovi]|uniref:MFS transporter n=1 Tax=Gallaecimonas mangrovi TaxID=2291597 RepID=UPI000E20A099|nr:MFS transporter [Gallaecimonas mangrovi]